MDGGPQIQGQRPQPPGSLCVLEFPESNLEPELGSPIPVLWPRRATGTPCPAPACRDLSSALPESHRKSPAKNLEPGEQDMAALDSLHPGGQRGTLTVDGAPGPAQDRYPTPGSTLAWNQPQGESEL